MRAKLNFIEKTSYRHICWRLTYKYGNNSTKGNIMNMKHFWTLTRARLPKCVEAGSKREGDNEGHHSSRDTQ